MTGQKGNGRRRDSRAQVIDELATIAAELASFVAKHADDIVAWADKRRAERNEDKSDG